MEIHNLNRLLDDLVKDEKSDIQLLKLTDDLLSIFVARLSAGKKLPAHYHQAGREVYQILAGEGFFDLGEWTGDTVLWNDSLKIGAGDVFEVPAGKVHRLSGGAEDLQMVFFAPPSHLGEDRIFIE